MINWWEPGTQKNYLEKSNCFIDQYENYTFDIDGETIHLNGVNTLGENIADNGGLKQALRAYDQLVARHGPEPLLPGLEYTQRQLFWISSASALWKVWRPSVLKKYILTDPHSPLAPRVNFPLSNLPEFATDWGCPAGSPMNPVNKCSVW